MVSLFYFALTQTIQKYMFGKLKSEFSWFLTIKLKFEISVFALYLHKTSEKHIGSSYTKMISALSSTKPDTQNTKKISDPDRLAISHGYTHMWFIRSFEKEVG